MIAFCGPIKKPSWARNLRPKVIRKELWKSLPFDRTIADFLKAFEVALQFNVYQVDKVQAELDDSIQKIKMETEKKNMIEKLRSGSH